MGKVTRMPELPEVETVRRGLAPAMEGRVIERVEQRRPDLRFPLPADFARRLAGRRVVSLGRRAKYLLADLDDGNVLVLHLGMSGSFRVEEAPERTGAGAAKAIAGESLYYGRSKDGAHDHVVFHMQDGHMAGRTRIVYNDPRRFGFMLLVPKAELPAHPLFARLGVEPTGNALTPELLACRFARRVVPLKAALIDQAVIAGLGNIYVCEALWRAGLSPRRAALTLVRADGKPGARLVRLVDSVRAVIADAIAAGGSSLRDHIQTDGSLGYFQHSFAVYGREGEPCLKPHCRGVIRRIVQSGRSTFYCPECQR